MSVRTQTVVECVTVGCPVSVTLDGQLFGDRLGEELASRRWLLVQIPSRRASYTLCPGDSLALLRLFGIVSVQAPQTTPGGLGALSPDDLRADFAAMCAQLFGTPPAPAEMPSPLFGVLP